MRRIITPILLSLGLIHYAGAPACATATWVGPAAYLGASVPGGAGVLDAQLGPASLVDLPEGFKLTDASFTYTAAATDVGQNLRLTWSITRHFAMGSPGDPNWFNVSELDGTVTYSATMIVSQVKLRTFTGLTSFDTNGAVVAPVPSGLPFAASYRGGPYLQNHSDDLWQIFTLSFTPNAAGASFTFDLPASTTSRAPSVLSSVPEPGSLVPSCIAGLIGLGIAWHRHHATTVARPDSPRSSGESPRR